MVVAVVDENENGGGIEVEDGVNAEGVSLSLLSESLAPWQHVQSVQVPAFELCSDACELASFNDVSPRASLDREE